ncbi:MAG: STAS domain-containing protein [Rhodospirillales bacterium]|nr:STAS domain-containing protein [Rhodospirillales bacterium]
MSDRVVALPSAIDARTIAGVKAQMEKAAAQASRVLVDASQVEHLGTAGAQLVLALAKRQGDAFALKSPSAPFVQAFEDLGLFPVLMSWTIEE